MIIGNRIALRAWEEDDLPLLYALRNNFYIQQQLMARPRPNSMTQVREWLSRRCSESQSVFFVIAEKSTGCAVGFVQAVAIDQVNGTARLGICVMPDKQGKGFASEACRMLFLHLRETYNLRKLCLEVLAHNEGAIFLYRRLGFKEVGCMHAHYFLNQKYEDVLLMEKFID